MAMFGRWVTRGIAGTAGIVITVGIAAWDIAAKRRREERERAWADLEGLKGQCQAMESQGKDSDAKDRWHDYELQLQAFREKYGTQDGDSAAAG